MTQVKVGDKIVADGSEWSSIADGTVLTVTGFSFDGCIHATIDNGDGFEWFMKSDTFKPYTPPLKIEAGKYYMTRDGRKVGPCKENNSENYPWNIPNNGDFYGYTLDGKSCIKINKDDIISEWSEPAPDDATSPPNLAALASEHGILITVTVGDLTVQYDGRT